MNAPALALVLEAAEPDDVPALVALERECFSHPWTAGNFQDALADTAHGRVIVLREAIWAGEVERGVRAYCVFEVAADELQIHNLAVHPVHRRQGLGRRLLEQTLVLGIRRGARVALLEVRPSNEGALRLYHSLGFQVLSRRRDYYRFPTEDALLLRKGGLR